MMSTTSQTFPEETVEWPLGSSEGTNRIVVARRAVSISYRWQQQLHLGSGPEWVTQITIDIQWDGCSNLSTGGWMHLCDEDWADFFGILTWCKEHAAKYIDGFEGWPKT